MSDPRFLRTGDLNFAMAHAAEEAGEFLAALGKSMRWGLDSVNPLIPEEERETNRDWLLREVADLRGALDRMETEIGALSTPAPDAGQVEAVAAKALTLCREHFAAMILQHAGDKLLQEVEQSLVYQIDLALTTLTHLSASPARAEGDKS